MALTDDNGTGMVMPVAPMGNYGGGFGSGFGNCFDGNGWWILLLFILLGNGAWGMGGFGGNSFAADGAMLYPWMNQAELTNGGFRDQMMNSNITSIRDGIGDISTQLCNGFGGVQTSLCNGFAGVNATVNSGFANAETSANARQMANMNQMFGAQTAMMQGFNGVNAGVADLRYTVATEACADRAAVGDALQNVTMQNMGNTNAIVNAINGGIQSIKDQLCDYRNAQKDDTIANLRQELMYSRGQASQVEQTAQLLANNNAQTALFQQGLNAEVDALYTRLNNCPVPTVPVYGRQPIFTCNNNCGCGGNTSF